MPEKKRDIWESKESKEKKEKRRFKVKEYLQKVSPRARNITIAIVLVLMATFLVKPVFTSLASLSTGDEGELKGLNETLLIIQSNLEESKSLGNTIFEENKELQNRINHCIEETATLEANNNMLNEQSSKDLENLRSSLLEENQKDKEECLNQLNEKETFYAEQISTLQDELNEMELMYYDFVKRTANNICCKKKVENTAIKYYSIKDNVLLCLEEEGSSLECPFN